MDSIDVWFETAPKNLKVAPKIEIEGEVCPPPQPCESDQTCCTTNSGYFSFAPQIFAPRNFEGEEMALGKVVGRQKSGRAINGYF